ncbi:MAG: hypothetical protein RMY29_024465 [Nostoc sp. CreGUA01]|nr:hypothetical protein [Nostoc sp. CreGUA01]
MNNRYGHWALGIGHGEEEAEGQRGRGEKLISPAPSSPSSPSSPHLPISPSPHSPLPKFISCK